jgi:hypothetical protein
VPTAASPIEAVRLSKTDYWSLTIILILNISQFFAGRWHSLQQWVPESLFFGSWLWLLFPLPIAPIVKWLAVIAVKNFLIANAIDVVGKKENPWRTYERSVQIAESNNAGHFTAG